MLLSFRLSSVLSAVFVMFSTSVISLQGSLNFAFKLVSMGNSLRSAGILGTTVMVSFTVMPVRSK